MQLPYVPISDYTVFSNPIAIGLLKSISHKSNLISVRKLQRNAFNSRWIFNMLLQACSLGYCKFTAHCGGKRILIVNILIINVNKKAQLTQREARDSHNLGI